MGAPTGKVHGRVNFSEHTSFLVSSKNYMGPAYSLMICSKTPVKSLTQKLSPTTVLLDTGASVSSMPLWQANALSVEVKPHTDIVIRGADGKPLAVGGVSKVWVGDPLATHLKKVKVVMTREGNWTLISPRD